MTLNDRLTTLRDLLAATPYDAAWKNLVACFDEAPEADLPTLLPYAHEHLNAWPDATRLAPLPWLQHNPIGHPALALCRSLRYLFETCDDHNAHLIARSPYLKNITIIYINKSEITESGISTLLHSPYFERLEILEIANTYLGDIILQELQARSVHHLTRLVLPSAHITHGGLNALAASPHLKGLEHLGLPDNPIDDDGAAILLQSPNLSALQELDLGDCHLGPAFGAHFAKATHLTHLHTLRLSKARLGPDGGRALLAAPHLTSLTALRLHSTQGGDTLADALSVAPHLSHLETLDLSHNDLTADGLRTLTQAPHLTSLRSLILDGNPLYDAGAEVLALSPQLAQLERLYLADCAIGSRGLQALTQSPYLLQLKALNLKRNMLDPSAKRAICKVFPFAVF